MVHLCGDGGDGTNEDGASEDMWSAVRIVTCIHNKTHMEHELHVFLVNRWVMLKLE